MQTRMLHVGWYRGVGVCAPWHAGVHTPSCTPRTRPHGARQPGGTGTGHNRATAGAAGQRGMAGRRAGQRGGRGAGPERAPTRKHALAGARARSSQPRGRKGPPGPGGQGRRTGTGTR